MSHIAEGDSLNEPRSALRIPAPDALAGPVTRKVSVSAIAVPEFGSENDNPDYPLTQAVSAGAQFALGSRFFS